MAYNAASHNAAGIRTGPVSGQPPQASSEVKKDIAAATAQDPIGQHAGGQDGGDKSAGQKVKSEKELEKERKKAEKLEKFKAKQAKAATSQPTSAKAKEKKEKEKEKESSAALPPYVEETAKGQKKILKPLDDDYHKAYIPAVVESAWYDWWEKEGFFKPQLTPDGKVKPAGYYEMAHPPPNVTGMLHMGHAINLSIEDTLARWYRMQGRSTLFLPGSDHAGIATQVVVEKMLMRREGKSRHDLGREKFIDLVWKWKDEYHQKITHTTRRTGVSMDWSREAFTMDKNLSAAVLKTFVQLHDEGLIYRAKRLVNWDTRLNTAISNLEVENKELGGRTLLDVPGYDRKVEFGVLTYFKYPLEGSQETIEVATTRPETMLGDTGIAVNPKDKRYQHLVGKKARHPFIDRLLPIFADEYVDIEFGTGAVKMTPAHDHNDFALGEKHGLSMINIMNDDGTLNENVGTFKGMKRFDARYEVIKQLKEKGLWVKQADNAMTVPISIRSSDVIEPIIKPQWFMRMAEMAEAAAEAVRDGRIKMRPEVHERNFLRWMDGMQDWCLSRQLWWGHQIPAYLVEIEGEKADGSDGSRWISAATESEATEKAKSKFPGKKFTLSRDEDVLDTWFSSQLWPFSTLGWPNKTDDLEKFFPTSLVETGHDINRIWVARMIMISLKMTGKIPFKEVYCHPMVRDSEGRKMSKSLGNTIDPVDVMDGIELEKLHEKLTTGNLDPRELATATKYQKTAFPNGIPECGADALRFSLVTYTTGGDYVNFDIKVIHGYRRFCNKVYQATKFVLGKLDQSFQPMSEARKSGNESLAEKWILHKFAHASKEINQALSDRDFSAATTTAYQYFYTQLCDVYIENSKTLIAEGSPEVQLSATNTLYTVLEGGLKLLHPFMPFLTEELWQRLPRRPNDKTPSIMLASYPTYEDGFNDPGSDAAYELILDIVKAIRSLTGQYSIKENGILHVQLFNPTAYETCTKEMQSIRSLAGRGVAEINLLKGDDSKPAGCVPEAVSAAATCFLHIKGRVDLDEEIKKIKKKMDKASETVKKSQSVINDEAFTNKASAELQETERQKLADAKKEVEEMQGAMERLEALRLE